MNYVTLNNGLKMPQLGFGVFKITDKEICEQAVYDAIKVGYRLFDTAAVYTNEDALGNAIRRAISEGIVTREELFITSKLWVQDMDYESAKVGIENSLKKSGLEYFDLYLLHQAARDYFGAYRALEEAYKEGKLKSIGVSNFYPNILANFCETVEIIPAVNQIELHPWFAQPLALEEAKRYGVIVEAWAPLGGGRYDAYNNPILKEIADKHHKTIAQVLLRWGLQRGEVVIPKSTHLERIQENFDVFDFELTEQEMNTMLSFDEGYSDKVKHFNPDFVRMILNNKIHD